ncbi:MAG: sensor histidine kinase [Paracoccus hibiscisoli]|uniref:sensor histidine kinase n=1 Tax=Paracoccus hibiscisoli TaxID=2023261 RepID=UPI003918F20B
MLTLQAHELERADGMAPEALAGPPGATRWSASDYLPRTDASGTVTLIDWTRRERIEGGLRITGVRSTIQAGQPRWLLMEFEGSGVKPYLPVIANELKLHVAIPMVPLTLLMLAFNVAAVRRVIKPLQRAEQEVDGLDPDDMSTRLTEPDAPREAKAMVGAINRALDRLETAMETLRTFTANAAHELRTPLSILESSIERLPPSQVRDELRLDSAHMTHLVAQMLDLAQADGVVLETRTIVDLGQIGRDAVAALTPIAFDANRQIVFEQRGHAMAQGHAEAIFRIYRTLIENALTHAPGETAIDVVAGPGPRISVRDYGPGISEADASKIFERFWRKDHRNSQGSGLGLGIVKRLAEVHRGGVSVQSEVGRGAVFTVWLQGPEAGARGD